MASLFEFLAKKSAGDSVEYGAFHVHCGSKILLSNERRAAHVKDFSIGIVYSSRPIPAGGMFQVKVLNRGLSMCISIGFTRLHPDSIDPVPESVHECWESKDYWTFCGSTAFHNGTRQDISFSTNLLAERDSVGVQVSENSDVHYYVNGQNKGRVFQHLPQHQDLWGVVILLHGTKIQSAFCFVEEMLK